MGIVLLDCPHCGAHKAAFASFGYAYEKRSAKEPANDYRAAVAFACPACEKPVVTRVQSVRNEPSWPNFQERIRTFVGTPVEIDATNLRIAKLWPEPPKPQIPEHIPEAAERALLQAERNFMFEGNEEAAAAMYRRALEIALKQRFPEVDEKLVKRIEKLVADGEITRQLGDWAHQIRLIGNDAVHEVENVARADLMALRGFTDAVFRYVFTLPAIVENRKRAAAAATDD